MIDRFDVAVVGAGMAGASLAAELAGEARVVLLEAEERPGYHTTGRSAAFWTESYGGPAVQPLTAASGDFLRAGGYLSPRSALTIGQEGQEGRIEDFAARYRALGVRVEILPRRELERTIEGLRPRWTCGVLEPSCSDIDVAALHQHYLARAGRGGSEIRLRSRVTAARPDGAGWLVKTEDGRQLNCRLLVNAAGAWADGLAQIAGIRPLGISPLRRTLVQLSVTPRASADLPLVLDIDEAFYFKPESGDVWVSPHDETPSPPCDATPEEIDVAIAIDRFESVVDWQVDRVAHRWAGLRSFSPDRLPVYGFDPENPRFFWFAGQGGFGIQTAPAAAELGASILLGRPSGPIDPAPYLPDRFA